MQLTHHDRDQLTVLAIRGELAADEIDRFRKAVLDRMDHQVRDFVLDLSQTEFIDSKGLETLLWLQEECIDRLGQVRLAGPNENLRMILRLTRLAGRFEVDDDVAAAIGSLR
jgi:anti-sigma B factor antagonist